MRDRLLHPATLIATLALLVALGVPGYAARTVDGLVLKRGSVTSRAIADGTVRSADLSPALRRAIARTGARGPVGPQGPQGATGPAGPQGAAAPVPGCPAGTALHMGGCIETARRPQLTWANALDACHAAGRRLPSIAEMQAYRYRSDLGAPTTGSEWTDSVGRDGATINAVYMTLNLGINDAQDAAGSPLPFRCVALPAG